MVRERDVQHGDSATMLNGNLRRAATVKRRFHFGDGFPDEVLTRERCCVFFHTLNLVPATRRVKGTSRVSLK